MSSVNNNTNNVSSSGSSSASDPTSAQAQKDQFLQILLTQLQHQNPTDPMKPEEFATQLAQFSALEQQVDTNTKLDTLIKQMSSSNLSPVSYLGNTVDYTSSTAPVQNGNATFTYTATSATSIDIVVKDASGNVVYSGKGDTNSGAHDLTLSVKGEDGSVDGAALTMTVTATDINGKTVTPVITARATITAVDTTSSTVSLLASGYAIPASTVTRIATPTKSASTTDTTTDTSTNS